MRNGDFIALCCGCVLMGIVVLRPWEPSDPDAIFSLGVGLGLMPAIYFLWPKLIGFRKRS